MKVPKITNVKGDKSHDLTEVVSDILGNTNPFVKFKKILLLNGGAGKVTLAQTRQQLTKE